MKFTSARSELSDRGRDLVLAHAHQRTSVLDTDHGLDVCRCVGGAVGVRYGSVKYEATRGRKSLEGSAAFFLAAFFSVHVPLLLLTELGRAATLLIGIMFGLLLAMVEAVAWSGLDNLFIPLAGFMLLEVYVGLDAVALGWRLYVTAFLMVVAFVARSRTWNNAALILAILVGYLCANLGGFPWLVIALWAFLGVVIISPVADAPKRTIGKWER